MARIKVTPAPEASTYFIDATNICHWGKEMSLQALLQLLLEIKRKKQSFFCIFDANTSYYIPDNEKKIYKKILEHTDYFYQVSGGKRADDFILELADRHGSAVISNDNYSDPKYAKYKWKDREAEPMRLFMGEVIPVPSGDHLILFDLDINIVLKEDANKLYKKLHRILYPSRDTFEGNVKFVNNHKGWGRIVYYTEDEVNFRTSELPQTVEQGQKVKFVIEETDKGEYARNIELLQVDEIRIKGKVTQYDESRGMGAIKPESGGGEDLFFYKSYFDDPENVPKINKNQRVSYVLGTNSKGECAKKIKLEADDPRDVQIKLLKDRNKYLEDKLRSKEDELKRVKQDTTQAVPAERSKDTSPQNPAQKNNKQEEKTGNNLPPKKQDDRRNKPKKGGKDVNGKKEHSNNTPENPTSKEIPNEEKSLGNERRKEESGEQNRNQSKKEVKVVLKKSNKPESEIELTDTTQPNVEQPVEELTEKSSDGNQIETPANQVNSQEKPKPKLVKKPKKYKPKAEIEVNSDSTKEPDVSKEEKPEEAIEVEQPAAKVEERPKPKFVKKSDKDAPAVEESSKKEETTEIEQPAAKVEDRPKPKFVKKSDKDAPAVEESSKKEETTEVEQPAAKAEERSKPKFVKKSDKDAPAVEESSKKEETTKVEQPVAKAEDRPKPKFVKKSDKDAPKVEETTKSDGANEVKQPVKKVKTSPKKQTPKPLPKKQKQVANTAKDDIEKQYSKWWKSLEKQWQMAFNVVVGNDEIIAKPTNQQIKTLLKSKRLSFYRTSKNKLSFKLTNLSGLRELTDLQTLNIAEHEISNLRGTEKLKNLQSLNCSKNQLKNLKGIESLKALKQFSCVNNELQFNNFANIAKQLPDLEKLDARNNRLSNEDKKAVKEAMNNIDAKF
ncbi:MAG: hypothetical protein R3E32_24330 [Chitinophagales bacterium]